MLNLSWLLAASWESQFNLAFLALVLVQLAKVQFWTSIDLTLESWNYKLLEAINFYSRDQRWSRGHKARGQGQGQGHKKNPRPRPRTAFPRTDTLEAKDRNARGQGQGPRTLSASALQKKKKKGLHKNFSGDLQKKKKKKKGLHKNFSSDLHEKTLSKKFFNRSTKF